MCGESLLEHYSQSWPGRVHLTSPGLCTILTGRVYIDRCVTKPIRGFKDSPLSGSVCGLALPSLHRKMY
jgi:hypothetical protein